MIVLCIILQTPSKIKQSLQDVHILLISVQHLIWASTEPGFANATDSSYLWFDSGVSSITPREQLVRICWLISKHYMNCSELLEDNKKVSRMLTNHRQQSKHSLGCEICVCLHDFYLGMHNFLLYLNKQIHFPFWEYKQSVSQTHVPDYLRAYPA